MPEISLKNIWSVGTEITPDVDELELFADLLLSDLSKFLNVPLSPFNTFISPFHNGTANFYRRFNSDALLGALSVQIDGVLCFSCRTSNRPAIFAELMVFSAGQRLTRYLPYKRNNILLSDPMFVINYEQSGNQGVWLTKGWRDGDGGTENIVNPRNSLYEKHIKFIDD